MPLSSYPGIKPLRLIDHLTERCARRDGEVLRPHRCDELTEKLKGFQEGDSVTLKVYRDTDLQQQLKQDYIDYTALGKNYDWVELTVQLKVLDQMDQNM